MKARSPGAASLLVALAAVGCEVQYRVGAIDDDLLASGAGAGTEAGRAGSAGSGGSNAAPKSECDRYAGEPPPVLLAPFAAPDVIWERLSQMVYGEASAPPSALPDSATPEWAGDVARQAFEQSAQLAAGAPLVRRYFTRALNLAEESELGATWTPRVVGTMPAVESLLGLPLAEPGRVGIWSEPEWLTRNPRIVSRGVRILSGVLNSPPPPPPSIVPTLPEDPASPGGTQRERLVRHRVDPVCAACHNLIDPLGFAFGNFDEVGVFQADEAGSAIDTSGTVSLELDPGMVDFSGIEELAPKLAASCTAQLAFADINFTLALVATGRLQEHERIPEGWLSDRDRVRAAFITAKTYPALVSAMAQTSPLLR